MNSDEREREREIFLKFLGETCLGDKSLLRVCNVLYNSLHTALFTDQIVLIPHVSALCLNSPELRVQTVVYSTVQYTAQYTALYTALYNALFTALYTALYSTVNCTVHCTVHCTIH